VTVFIRCFQNCKNLHVALEEFGDLVWLSEQHSDQFPGIPLDQTQREMQIVTEELERLKENLEFA
jgi:metal-dependent hydrolase (beta-lactamase superfamily II)